MTSLEYWKERERAAAEEYAVTDEEALRRTQEVYARLLASVNDRINAFYSRYADAEGITMNLAEQAVSQFDVKAFEATAAKMVADKDFSPQANQQLRLYNATMRINRLEMLKAYIGLDTIDAGYDLEHIADYYLTDRSRQEFERQAGILGNSVRPTAKDVDDIVHSSFYNATFSHRIWANMSELHDELSTILTNGIIQGINPRQMTSRMAERFNVSEYDAERLLRTEMARVQTETQRQSFQMAGFEYYVFISLEGRACPVCAALDTGEPIPLEDFMPGETAPPVHPNCRCSVAAWMDREQMEKELGFALDEEEDEAAAAPEPQEPEPENAREQEEMDEALEFYVSGDGMYINSYLAGLFEERGGTWTEEDQRILDLLDKATSDTVKESVLYRSVDASSIFGQLSDSEYEDLKNFIKYGESSVPKNQREYFQNWIDSTVGKEITEPRMMSTTTDKEVALNWYDFSGSEKPLVLEIEVPEGTKGADLKRFDIEEDPQNEILLHRDQTYTVEEITTEEGQIYVKIKLKSK